MYSLNTKFTPVFVFLFQTNILLDWEMQPEQNLSVDVYVEMLWKAIQSCIGDIDVENPEINGGQMLYINIINLLKANSR